MSTKITSSKFDPSVFPTGLVEAIIQTARCLRCGLYTDFCEGILEKRACFSFHYVTIPLFVFVATK